MYILWNLFISSNLTQRRTSQEGHQHHKSNQDLTETCFKKVKRKLCTKSNTELSSSSKDIVKVTRNYNNYYEKEYSHVSPFSQTNNKPQPQPHNSLEIIESLNVAKLQKNMSDGKSKKENNHAQQVLSKWMWFIFENIYWFTIVFSLRTFKVVCFLLVNIFAFTARM